MNVIHRTYAKDNTQDRDDYTGAMLVSRYDASPSSANYYVEAHPDVLTEIEEEYGIPKSDYYADPETYIEKVKIAASGQGKTPTGSAQTAALTKFIGGEETFLTMNATQSYRNRVSDMFSRSEGSESQSAQMNSYASSAQALILLTELGSEMKGEEGIDLNADKIRQ